MDAAAHQRRHAGGDLSLAAVILGNDALLAARPSTPAQLVNACIAAGFDLVVPPAWGDELVAAAYLERLAKRDEPVIAACACPKVATLLSQAGTTLPRLALAPPPVAVARALRAVHGEAILVTYVGACPAAGDPSIDVRFMPGALFVQLERQGVKIADQPAEFAGGDADRWRRYASMPGGLPALRFLARAPVDRVLRTVDAAALARGQMPATRSRVLVDLADAAQCVCGGRRDEIEEGELPRSRVPVVHCPIGASLSPDPSPRGRRFVSLPGSSRAPGIAPSGTAPSTDADTEAPAPDIEVRPAGSATGVAAATAGAERPVDEAPPVVASRTSRSEVEPSPAPGERPVLAVVPAVVLALIAALGIAVYAAAASHTARPDAAPPQRDSSAATIRPANTWSRGDSSLVDSSSAALSELADSSAAHDAPPAGRAAADSAARAVDGITRRDSVRASRPRRVRREPLPEVVPGWMPQGQPTFVPSDARTGVRDSSQTAPQRDSVRPDSGRPPT